MTPTKAEIEAAREWLKIVIEHRKYVRSTRPLPDDDAYAMLDNEHTKTIRALLDAAGR